MKKCDLKIEGMHLLVCIIIPALSGLLFSFIDSLLYRKEKWNLIFVYWGIGIGVFIWLLNLFIRTGCIRLFFKDYIDEDSAFFTGINEYGKQCYCIIKQIYYCRDYASKRLVQDEFWIQLISIYYSVFTAILAVLGLVGKEMNDFLDVPSVLFTIAVAILVTFANAQRCGSRANDLSSNCSDLGERFSEVTEIVKRPNTDSRAKQSELKECMSRFYKNLGDSEEHSVVDEWKYTGNWLYSVYLSIKIVMIYLLIMIPIIFVFCYWNNFLHLFSFVGGYDNCGSLH